MTNELAGEASQATAAATSSGVPIRPGGTYCPIERRTSAGCRATPPDDRPRRDGVDPDPAAGVVHGRGTGQPDDAVLGRDVRRHPGHPIRPRVGSDVDQSAAVDQGGELVLHGDRHAAKGAREDPVDLLDRQLVQRRRLVRDADVVDGDLEPVVGGGVPDQVGERVVVAYVDRDRLGLHAVRAEPLGERREPLAVAGRQRERVTGGAELVGDRRPDQAVGAENRAFVGVFMPRFRSGGRAASAA